MHRFTYILILSALYGFILSGCYTRKIKEREYITVRDTVITPPIVKLDTLTQWNDRFIYLKDSTNQMSVVIERIKNNYIKVKADCVPKKIIVPITKTVVKSKQVIVESFFWKRVSLVLLLVIGVYVIYAKFLPRGV
ncbi:hypothetical protein UFOVP384_19 [uncultured Caudovirales phage]|uniref:Lipoprotein n=1 Tax=uncultured Caudovirales phage TaxID=2100421 RepID=A0A6J7WYU3_9CAUD|nr:hypothetical protein UFOVP384_19 [uncultured Caudovirales phage]